jgi:hypothetical protein
VTAYKGEYPNDLNLRGQLSFPLYTEKNIEEAKEWRKKKGFKALKFDEKRGATLLLKPLQFERLQQHLIEVVIPFGGTLFKATDGEKGVEPDVVKALLKQMKDGNYIGPDNKPNLPIRRLSEADIKNTTPDGETESPYVGKVKFQGPYKEDLPISVLLVDTNTGKERIITIQDLVDDEILPANRADTTRLWWGAGWKFKTSLRFNVFDAASIGVSAFAQKVYLLPHLGLPISAGGDANIIEDGDDWSDEE